MPMFRKKPVEIEARQVPDPEHSPEDHKQLWEIALWCGGEVVDDAVDGRCILINTLEGQMKAVSGAYVIKGVKGEFYPCAADIFAQTYDLVEA